MITEILNYTIVSKIGEGGMGHVFLAKNKSIDQYVAIKMLHPRFSSNPLLRERFRQEAIMLSSLSHPNIVKFLNYVENEHGVFLIMEYVEGMTLEDYQNKKTGLIVEQKALPMMMQILDAFSYAHGRKVVHRDIKPSNIFVTNDGNIKIVDFGIAQIISETHNQQDNYSGTPEYMSPEQIKGLQIDERSDIYSLGVLFYQMLTGKPPYDSSSMSPLEIKRNILEVSLKPMRLIYPYISNGMQALVDKATCKNPIERFGNCNDMISFLRQMNNHNSKNDSKKKIKLKWIFFAAISVAIITAGGILGYIHLVNNIEKTFDDYTDVWGIAQGIPAPNANNDANHYKLSFHNGKLSRLTYVNAQDQPTPILDSILARYKHIDVEFIYRPDGKLDHKKIYDQNGVLTHKISFKDDFHEAIVEVIENDIKNRFKLNYDPSSGRLSSLYYLNNKGEKTAVNGAYGELYNYNNAGRLDRVTFLDENYNPGQDASGVGIISFVYDKNLANVKSSFFDPTGKPVVPQIIHEENTTVKKKHHRKKDNSAESQNSNQHQYLKENMKKNKPVYK